MTVSPNAVTPTTELDAATPASPSRTFWVRLGLAAALALAVRLAYLLGTKRHSPPVGDAIYYSGEALTIARGHWFTHPYVAGPAADHPPGTAVLLAPAAWLAPGSLFAQRLLVTIAGVGVVVLIGLLTRRLAGDRAGIVAAVIAALYANLWMNDVLTMSETFSAAFIVFALLALYRYADAPGVARAAVAGAVIGAAVLVRAELALLAPLVLLPLILRSGHDRLRQLAAAAAALLAVNAPWFVFNLTRFNDVVFVSTNDGLTIRGANCKDTYSGNGLGFWDLRCALDDPAPAGSDESEQSAWWRDHGFEYMTENLDRLPAVMTVRVLRTWSLYEPEQMNVFNQGEDRDRWASKLGVYSFWLLAPVAVAGAVVLRRRRVLLLPLLALPVIVTLVAAWFYGLVRFRLPAEISVVVLAAVAVDALMARRGRAAAAPTTSPARHDGLADG